MDINVEEEGIKFESTAATHLDIATEAKIKVKSQTEDAIFFPSSTAQVVIFSTAGAPISFSTDNPAKKAIEGPTTITAYDATVASPAAGTPYVLDKTVMSVNGHDYSGTEAEAGISVPAGEGWAWNPTTRTITLSGYNGEHILLDDDLNVVIADGTDNTITNTTYWNAISSSYSLNITGNGNLTINQNYGTVDDDNAAIRTFSGNTTINMGGKLTINSTQKGIRGKSLTIGGTGDIDINSARVGLESREGDLVYNGTNKLTVNSSDEYAVELLWTGVSFKIDGTGHPLSFTSADGNAAVYNKADFNSPVVLTNASFYDNITGAPEESTVIYDVTPPPAPTPEPGGEDVGGGDSPWTGDRAQTPWWIALFMLSAFDIGVFGVYKRRRVK